MRIYVIGWSLIALCSIAMGFSMNQDELFGTSFMLWLFAARLFGISGFLCGVMCLVQLEWTHGTLLIISALVLPIISYVVHSTI
jgi:hypothetical protein